MMPKKMDQKTGGMAGETKVFWIVIVVIFVLAWVTMFSPNPNTRMLKTAEGHEFLYHYIEDTDSVTLRGVWESDWAYTQGVVPVVAEVGAQLMVEGGNSNYSAADLHELNYDYDYAFEVDSYLGRTYVNFSVKTDEFRAASDWISQNMESPLFEKRWIDRIADRKLLKRRAWLKSVSARSERIGLHAVFKQAGLPFAISSEADDQLYKNISREDVMNWHSHVFDWPAQALVVVGNISKPEAKFLVDRVLQKPNKDPWTNDHIPLDETKDTSGRLIVLHDESLQQAYLGFMGPMGQGEGYSRFEEGIVDKILFSRESSIVYAALREDLRATYGFGSRFGDYDRDQYYLYFSGEIDVDKLEAARKLVLDKYEGFLQGSIDLEEVKALTSQKSLDLQNDALYPSRISKSLLTDVSWEMDVGHSLNIEENLAAVTDETVKAYVDAVIPRVDNLIQIIMTPDISTYEDNELVDACIIHKPEQAADC